MLAVGFAGTKQGLSRKQRSAVESILRRLCAKNGSLVCHAGDSIGADFDFHALCRIVGREKIRLVVHPPAKEHQRAFVEADEVREPQEYAGRVRGLVGETLVVIACPRQQRGEGRGGTWGVIKFANAKGRRVFIVRPDGSCVLRVLQRRI